MIQTTNTYVSEAVAPRSPETHIAEIHNATLDRPPDPRFFDVDELIVKLTNRCNLDCSYCYEDIAVGQDMSLVTFGQLADQVMASSRHGLIKFVFHGGEPTLVHSEWFRSATTYARRSAYELGKEAKFAIQTNGISLTDEKIQLLLDLEIGVSISIDDAGDIETPMRKRGATAVRGYLRAVKAGLKPGVIMTINHTNFDRFATICRWLTNEIGVREFKANVLASVGKGLTLDPLKPNQIFRAHKDILEYMIETGGKGALEDNLQFELMRFFASPEDRREMPETLCKDIRCGAGRRVLGITPAGELLPCGRFPWNDPGYFLGSVHESRTQEILRQFTDSVQIFHSTAPENWYKCGTCEAQWVCAYGCQAFIVQSRAEKNIECIPTKMRYQYYLDNRQRLQPVIAEILRRKTLAFLPGWGDKHQPPYNDSKD